MKTLVIAKNLDLTIISHKIKFLELHQKENLSKEKPEIVISFKGQNLPKKKNSMS